MPVSQPYLQNVPIAPDPNIPQRQAANPDSDVWVAASAGSGKTKVLTDRVLRLLLPDPEGRWDGVRPHKILCITFTKAAAALMALRVQKKLADWSVMDDAGLRKDLKDNLFGVEPADHVVTAARQLFSQVLDVPGGLSIMTIHAFCQATLGRFPLEAGITPEFNVLDEIQAVDTLAHIVTQNLRDLQDGRLDLELVGAFERLAVYMDIESLQSTLLSLLSDTWKLKEFLESAQTPHSIRDKLLQALNYPSSITQSDIWQNFVRGLPLDDMRQIAVTLANAGKRDHDNGQKLASWLAIPADRQMEAYPLLYDAFFKKDGDPRKIYCEKDNPDIADRLAQLRRQIDNYAEQLAALTQVEQTTDLLLMALSCLSKYENRKRQLNALDFTDLILKTRQLLESQAAEWVHYKLDEGIDHILVDEAQDTNNHQWEIIKLLSAEFHAGWGRDSDRPRSLFVVGDKKQSIFSFHGADPAAFDRMQAYFASRAAESGREFIPVNLETSFRTTAPLLELVDTVFEDNNLARQLGLTSPLVHYTHRPKDSGRAEIWPMLQRGEPPAVSGPLTWALPPVAVESIPTGQNGNDSVLARQIALQVSAWLTSGERLKSSDKPIEPRDILILVRTRTGFVSDLVRHLKLLNVPVSGVDRMQLNDQIAVMDCLALARFCRLPDDDLSLACVLKSPFIRLNDDELMTVALNRSGSLWSAVQQKLAPNIVAWLREMIARAQLRKPFEFFDEILNESCPRDRDGSAWRAFAQELGDDCRDGLEEFLGHCLRAEQDGIFGLEEFIVTFQKRNIDVKRELAEGDKESHNQVRIMTVHASKGLEAPIVLLPDTTGYPDRGKLDRLQWVEEGQHRFPLWSAGSARVCTAYQNAKNAQYERNIAEYMRLLYVALTRARDRLYIMGEAKPSRPPKPDCWYNLINAGFDRMDAVTDTHTGRKHIESPQDKAVEKKDRKEAAFLYADLPTWLRMPPKAMDIRQITIINPSRLPDGDERVISPYQKDDQHRFLRGNLTHRLFQILPQLPGNARRRSGEAFLKAMGAALSDAVRQDILNETLSILTDPVFADVFGPKSMAEVPVSGPIGGGQVINGQIDRLVVDGDRVLIVDFKTNRPSPRSPESIPPAYRDQLKAYKTALSLIYPGKTIHCALLWTDQPLLMPIQV